MHTLPSAQGGSHTAVEENKNINKCVNLPNKYQKTANTRMQAGEPWHTRSCQYIPHTLTVAVDIVFTHEAKARDDPGGISTYDEELRDTGPNLVAFFAHDLQPVGKNVYLVLLPSDLIIHVYSINVSLCSSPHNLDIVWLGISSINQRFFIIIFTRNDFPDE